MIAQRRPGERVACATKKARPIGRALCSPGASSYFEMRSFDRLLPIWVNTSLIWPDDVTV